MKRTVSAAARGEGRLDTPDDLAESDIPLVAGEFGREDNQGAEPGTLAADDIHQPIGAARRSEITARHEPGSGANETEDGLSGSEEMTRQIAEDLPTGAGDDVESIPVFDRGDTLPRV